MHKIEILGTKPIRRLVVNWGLSQSHIVPVKKNRKLICSLKSEGSFEKYYFLFEKSLQFKIRKSLLEFLQKKENNEFLV